jgi:uncharacterized protein YjbJ (UPF0337 family)
MNRNIVAGAWKQFKGRVETRWGFFIDDAVRVVAGQRAERAGRLQQDYGMTADTARYQIEVFRRINRDWCRKGSS